MNPPTDPEVVFFSIKPNLMGGEFLFYFGPWDRMDALRAWYCSHGISDVHHRIKDWNSDGRPDGETYEAQVFDPYPGHPLLAMKTIPHTAAEIGSFVHEIHHAVQRWTQALGIYTSRDSEEIFAYVEGMLVDRVLDYLWHGTVADGLRIYEPPAGE